MIKVNRKPWTIAGGTMLIPAPFCSIGSVKSIDVAPHKPNAVNLYRLIRVGIRMMAHNSRRISFRKVALPIIGP